MDDFCLGYIRQGSHGLQGEAGMQTLMGEDMREDDAGALPLKRVGIGLDERELPQMLPDIFRRALMQEGELIGREVDGVIEIAVTNLRSGFAYGQQVHCVVCIGLTPGLERTMCAVGRGGHAV